MQHPKQVKYTILGIQSKLVGKNKKTQIEEKNQSIKQPKTDTDVKVEEKDVNRCL